MKELINHPTRSLIRFCERIHLSEDVLIGAFCVSTLIAAFCV